MEEVRSVAGPSSAPRIELRKRRIVRKRPKDAPGEIVDGSSIWSVTEKKKLLYAVKKYGWRNSDKLVATVQTKSKSQIERFLLKKQKVWKRLSQVHFTGNVAPVEVWLEKAQKMSVKKPYYARSLSTAFSMIGQCENFPTRNTRREPNYPELYEYFAHLLRGNTPTSLSEGNRRIVLKLLEMVAAILKGSSWTEEGQFFTQHSVAAQPSARGGPSGTQTAACSRSTVSTRLSPIAQMECDDSNSQPSNIKIKTEICDEAEATAGPSSLSSELNNSSSYSQFDDVKQYLFSDDPELATMNPFKLPFHMFRQASAKVEQHLLKQN